MREDLAVVLDIGTSKVACLAADASGPNGFTVLAVAAVPCHGVVRGAITDADAVSRAIYQAVHQVQQDLREDVEDLIVTISGPGIEGQTGRGLKQIVPRARQITNQDVLEVVNHSRAMAPPADKEQIQAIPREFRVDGQRDVKRPVGMTGAKLEAITYLVLGQTVTLNSIEKVVEMAGKRVEQMVLRPLGSGIGVLTPDEIESGSAVVDIGESMTELAIFVGGSIAFSGTIPIGSGHVTRDISKLLKTSIEEAERLKVESGAAFAREVPAHETVTVIQEGQSQARPMQRSVLSEIIESRMREIANLVRQQFDQSGLGSVLPGGVTITGGGAMIPGADRLFDETIKHLRFRIAPTIKVGGKSIDPRFSASLGAARFAIQCFDEIAPAAGPKDWKERVRSLFSVLRS